MAIKLILLDLDGTLLTSDKQISPANYAALERAQKAGVQIVPCTGRFFDGMPQVVRELPLFRYAVTVNGAQIYDRERDTILHRCEIQPADAQQIYDRLDTLPVIYDCFMDGWGYMDKRSYDRIDQFIADPRVNKMVKELRKPVEDFRGFMAAERKPVQKIQMFFNDMELRKTVWEQLIAEFPEMAVTSSISNNVEINAKNANKGEALRFLCRHLGLEISESMAFGDGNNDLAMIRAAGLGVAMANADEELKAEANYITDTNNNDGVAKAIEKFVFA